MPSRNTKFYSLMLLVADFIILTIAFVGAYILRVQFDHRPLLDQVYARNYFVSFLIVAPFWLIVFASLTLYRANTYNRRLAEWWRIFIGSLIGILLVIGWQYVSERIMFPARLVAVYAFVASFVLLIIEREVLRAFRSYLFRHGRGTSRVLVIGNSEATRDIALSLADTKKSGYHISAIAGPKTIVPDELSGKTEHFSSLDDALRAIAA
ncbi:MAG TPA: sugar transferase, partial [Candidatus Saccharimonadaceae bacterium]|nr:sugar transferase [Candidatus Saccharimonadaceae bacterium]